MWEEWAAICGKAFEAYELNSELQGKMVELSQALVASRGEGPGNAISDELIIERHGQGTHSGTCKWNIAGFSNKQKVLYSKYFEVGGYDCRLLVYPSGA